DEVQRRAGAWANVTSKTWVRKVLGVVTLKCVKEGWPHLASLVVRPSDGKPGPWYFDVLAETGPGSAQDESHHAARQRLDCYEHFGADVPDGADPTLDPLRRRRTVRHLDAKPAPTRSAKTKATPPARTRPAAARKPQAPSEERRGKVCPTCFMEMPLSGVCANCAGAGLSRRRGSASSMVNLTYASLRLRSTMSPSSFGGAATHDAFSFHLPPVVGTRDDRCHRRRDDRR